MFGKSRADRRKRLAQYVFLADHNDEEEETEEKREELISELEAEGLDVIQLECMDEDERREAIEETGLDSLDFDELFDE